MPGTIGSRRGFIELFGLPGSELSEQPLDSQRQVVLKQVASKPRRRIRQRPGRARKMGSLYPLSEFDGRMKTKDWSKLPAVNRKGSLENVTWFIPAIKE
jgi:hypothetical protein